MAPEAVHVSAAVAAVPAALVVSRVATAAAWVMATAEVAGSSGIGTGVPLATKVFVMPVV